MDKITSHLLVVVPLVRHSHRATEDSYIDDGSESASTRQFNVSIAFKLNFFHTSLDPARPGAVQLRQMRGEVETLRKRRKKIVAIGLAVNRVANQRQQR